MSADATPETIFLSTNQSRKTYHVEEDCAALVRCDTIHERAYEHRPLRSECCQRCGGDAL